MHSVMTQFWCLVLAISKEVCIILSRYLRKPLTVLFFFPPKEMALLKYLLRIVEKSQ